MYIYIYIHTHTQKYTFYVSTNIHPLTRFNPLNADLNPICHLLVLLGAHHILHISRISVNSMILNIYSLLPSISALIMFLQLYCVTENK